MCGPPCKTGALAHLARALDWQSKGDRFESDMLHITKRLYGRFFCCSPRRKRCLFLPGTATEHLLRRVLGVFLPGRRVVTHSAQEKMPFSAWNRHGAPSAQDLGHFSARQMVPVRQAGGIPFCAGMVVMQKESDRGHSLFTF